MSLYASLFGHLRAVHLTILISLPHREFFNTGEESFP